MSTRPQHSVIDGHTAQGALPLTAGHKQPTAMTAPIPKLLLTVTEAASQLSVSRAHMYRLLQAGELRSVHSMGAMRIPSSELTNYVERLLQDFANADANPR